MRAVVFAYSDVGYACLDLLLAQGAEIAAVFTHEDDPAERVWFRSVRGLAAQHGLPVFTPERLDGGDWLARLRAWAPDFIFSFYYRRLLPTAVLETARLAAVNLHGSLLPRYRGRCPVNWVLINGETETGVTLHHMVAKADAGDIVAQRRVAISDDDTAYTLYGKQTAAAIDLMQDVYPRLCAGTAPRIAQDHAQANSAAGGADGPSTGPERARPLQPGAGGDPSYRGLTHWRGQPLMIWRAQAEGDGRNGRRRRARCWRSTTAWWSRRAQGACASCACSSPARTKRTAGMGAAARRRGRDSSMRPHHRRRRLVGSHLADAFIARATRYSYSTTARWRRCAT
jgi:folate-dependent phosphoribosylglycinamide formyltransferase PurN